MGTFAIVANAGGRAMFNTLVTPDISGGTGFDYFTEADVYTNTTFARWTYERYGFPQTWVQAPPTPNPEVATPEIETELESDGADALRAQLDWKLRDGEDPATNPVYYGPQWATKPASHEHRWCEVPARDQPRSDRSGSRPVHGV